MAGSLHGKVVFITGPARGIGAEASRQLAVRGGRLALAANGAVQRFGRIDVVVANAGIASFGTVAVTPVESLARLVDVNLTGVIRTVSATLPRLVESRGYVMIVASAASFAAMPGLATYAATKAAVEQFANPLRYEVAHRGVDVGTVHPSWIETDLVRDARADFTSFDNLLCKLPGPFGTMTSVSACAAAMVDAIAGRRRRVFVPKSLAGFAALRDLMARPPLDYLVRRVAGGAVPDIEREALALGRSFGVHSVETTRAGGLGRQDVSETQPR